MKSLWLKIKDGIYKFFNFEFLPAKKKLVIVMSGGAMNCAYGAGFLSALSSFNLPKDTAIIAASGNAGNATYFASGQGEVGRDVWVEYLSGDRLINYRRRKILDIDYLVDEIFKKQFPLDVAQMRNSDIEVIVPAICYETAYIKYFSSRDNNLDWFEVLRAAKALPIVYGKRVNIGGLHYFDTPYSSSWDVHIQKAESLGATHLIVVDLNKLYPNRASGWIGEFIARNFFFSSDDVYNPIHLQNRENYQKNTENQIYIRPKFLLDNLETDRAEIAKLWDSGLNDALNNVNLKNLLDNLQK